MSDFHPKARRGEILSEGIGDELVLYDATTLQGHSLNRVAAAVWRGCDGETSVPELARRVSAALGTVTTEDLVWHALGELGDRRLLEEAPDAHLGAMSLSRRELVERLGVAAGLTLALVSSMPIPAAAQAGSPGPPGQTGPTGATGSNRVDVDGSGDDQSSRVLERRSRGGCPQDLRDRPGTAGLRALRPAADGWAGVTGGGHRDRERAYLHAALAVDQYDRHVEDGR